MVYLDYITCLRYTILVQNPRITLCPCCSPSIAVMTQHGLCLCSALRRLKCLVVVVKVVVGVRFVHHCAATHVINLFLTVTGKFLIMRRSLLCILVHMIVILHPQKTMCIPTTHVINLFLTVTGKFSVMIGSLLYVFVHVNVILNTHKKRCAYLRS